MCERTKASCLPAFRLCPAWGAGPRARTPRSEGRFAPMKRKGAPAKEGTCPRDAPKDQKCDNCRLRKGACQFAARIAGHALPSPDEPSTSKPRPTQPVADSDMDIDRPNTRPSRQCQPPERFECDDDLRSKATGSDGQLIPVVRTTWTLNLRRPSPLRSPSSPARWTSTSATGASRQPSTPP